jgi:hypothetical protein
LQNQRKNLAATAAVDTEAVVRISAATADKKKIINKFLP